MENNWKKNHPDQRKQAIEITSALMDVDYVPVDDVQELTAIERGDNGWREVSVEKRGLVRCISPIRGTVYRVRRFGCSLDKHYIDAMVRWTLESRKGRVFANEEGALRVAFDLPNVELDALLLRIMMDA